MIFKHPKSNPRKTQIQPTMKFNWHNWKENPRKTYENLEKDIEANNQIWVIVRNIKVNKIGEIEANNQTWVILYWFSNTQNQNPETRMISTHWFSNTQNRNLKKANSTHNETSIEKKNPDINLRKPRKRYWSK